MKKKKLLEMRAAKQKRMKEILEAATNEERALNTEERDEFGTLEEEITFCTECGKQRPPIGCK